MSFAATFVQLSFPLLSLATVMRAAFMLFLLASLFMFFRPLLNGILRALLLALRSRLTRKPAPPRTGMAPGQRA